MGRRPQEDRQEFDSILWETLTEGEEQAELDQSYVNESSAAHCGKLRAAKMLLKEFHQAGDKVLLFSFSTQLLDVIEAVVQVEGYVFDRLDGSTPQEQRGLKCATFNHDPSMFLMLVSTKAGGLGLNLAAANKVIIFDPNWNPSFDLQAQDRAFRIGQQRFVSVYRLITSGTIEEVVYNRQIAKQQMANATLNNTHERRYFTGVMGPNGGWLEEGELGGVHNLFSLTKDEVTTREIEAREAARAQERGRHMLNIKKIPQDIMDAMKEQGGDETKDEDALLKELAQEMGLDVGVREGAAGEDQLMDEGAVHIHLNSSTDSSRRQMIGNSVVEEMAAARAAPGSDDEDGGAAAYPHPLQDAMPAAAAAAARPRQKQTKIKVERRARASPPPGAAAAAAAGGGAAAAAAKPDLEECMRVVGERHGLALPDFKQKLAAADDEERQALVAEIQAEARPAVARPKRQQTLPQTLAKRKPPPPKKKLEPFEVLQKVAEAEGFTVQQFRAYVAECKSEEGRREYGADHCDAELARLHQLTDDIQAGNA